MAHKEELFGDQVTIVSSDMREWKAPELADIIVSELLGSFGDNELSPECLDGAQKFLKGELPSKTIRLCGKKTCDSLTQICCQSYYQVKYIIIFLKVLINSIIFLC